MRVNIYLTPELHERLKLAEKKLNVSQICRDAIEEALNENASPEVKFQRIEQQVRQLKKQLKGSK